MSIRPAASLLLALTLAFTAGCTSAMEDALGVPADRVAQVIPWGFEDCRFAVAVIPVDSEALAAHLPEGFRSLSPSEAGLPNDPRGDANLGIEIWSCGEGIGMNGTLADASYGAIFSFVEPPAHLAEEVKFHFVKWDMVEPDAARRATLSAAGAPVHEGEASFGQAVPGVKGFTGTLQMNGTYEFTGSLPAPVDPGMESFRFTEFTPLPDGRLVVTRAEVAAPGATQGSGTVQIPPGFARDVVGSDRAQAYILGGTGAAFRDASITLPPTAGAAAGAQAAP